jgi:hypothetical protein
VDCTQPVTLDYLTNPLQKVKAGAEWLLGKEDAVCGSNIWEAGGLVFGDKNDETITYPNLQYHFAPVYSARFQTESRTRGCH